MGRHGQACIGFFFILATVMGSVATADAGGAYVLTNKVRWPGKAKGQRWQFQMQLRDGRIMGKARHKSGLRYEGFYTYTPPPRILKVGQVFTMHHFCKITGQSKGTPRYASIDGRGDLEPDVKVKIGYASGGILRLGGCSVPMHKGTGAVARQSKSIRITKRWKQFQIRASGAPGGAGFRYIYRWRDNIGASSVRPAVRPRPSGPVRTLYRAWNKAACQFTNTSRFTLRKPTQIHQLTMWYRWQPRERQVHFRLLRNGRMMQGGYFHKTSCDPHQRRWCAGVSRARFSLPPGSYTVILAQRRQCQNRGSRGNGFIEVTGR